MNHDEYVKCKRRQVVETAKAMLDGELGFLLGSRRLAILRHEVDVPDAGSEFFTFVCIESETDALPIGEVRRYWSPDALAKLELEIQSAEAWAAEAGRDGCRRLIERFDEPESR